MAIPVSTTAILIATDIVSDAALVKKLLSEEFRHVVVSTDPDKVAGDFVRYQPDVLVLAFKELEKSESYYLSLYHLCPEMHRRTHRTVILCNKDEVTRAYELCMKDYFDDYIMFWPMTYDKPRLAMSVHHMLRELAALKGDVPSAAEFAVQARRLAELEKILSRQVAQVGQHIEVSSRAMAQVEQDIGTALDGFSQRLVSDSLQGSVMVKNADDLKKEISRFKREEVQQYFHTAAKTAKPLKRWAHEFKQECEPLIESARTLTAMAGRILPVVLVVDDDEFQRKLIGQILEAENYHLVFAGSGIETLNVMRKLRPDIILMDVMMPDMDGIEATQLLKVAPPLAGIPVIMITGQSEGKVVLDSMKAGATDFVVKPLDRDTLIAKITRALTVTADSRMVSLAVPHQHDGLVSYKGDVMAPNTINSGTSSNKISSANTSNSSSTSANTNTNTNKSSSANTSNSSSTSANTNTNTNKSSSASRVTGATNALSSAGTADPARLESQTNTTGSAGAAMQHRQHAEQDQNIGSNINIKV